jgi:hypothetical protein
MIGNSGDRFLIRRGVIVAALFITHADLHCGFAEPIPVKEKRGAMSGFVVLKTRDGRVIAVRDEVETVEGSKIHSRAVFRFRDGSIDDEASVFTQGTAFRLLTDRHIQKGPSFPQALDISFDVPSGTLILREMKQGKEEVKTEHMDLPVELANGMTPLIVENFPRNQAVMKISYLAGGSKPRLVTLSAKPDGADNYEIGGVSRRSKKFRIHIDIGGVAGVIAPLLGKQPPDIEMWVSDGEVPVFLKMVGRLYANGPIWITQIASPVWSEAAK